jgi:hypothetical protein
MKIVQICAAHVEQGAEPCLYGLGDDGHLYEWIPEMNPQKTKEPVTEDVPEDELAKVPWKIAAKRQVVDPITKQMLWKDKFIDGCTGGWKDLGTSMSKKVPHPEDPTRNERQ